MANVQQVALCPFCKAELPIPVPTQCPACSRALSGPKNPYFGSPEYLSFQYDDLAAQHDPLRRDADAKPLTAEDTRKWPEIQREFIKWLRECPEDDKLCALRDASFVMMNVMHSSTPIETLRSLTKLGKQIGKLAEAVEAYHRCGGEPHDPEAGRVQTVPGDDGGGEETTFGGGRTS